MSEEDQDQGGRLRAVERELAAARGFLDKLEEVGRIGSWTSGFATQELCWSRQTYRIFGIEPGTPVKVDDFFARVHPDDRAKVRAAVAAAAAERVTYRIDHRVIRPDGAELWVHEDADLEYGLDGTPLRLIGVVRDITEERLGEERLQESVKLEAVARLAGGIAHDYNNLLTVVLGYAELLTLHAAGADPGLLRAASEIRRAAERAANLTRQLLAAGRRQVLLPRPLAVGELIAGLRSSLHRLLAPVVRVEVCPGDDGAVVLADREQLEQAILALAGNARQAMPDGGTLGVALKRVMVRPEDAARLDLPPGEYARIEVRDDGVGMDEETRRHVFEPFYSTRGGSGLGLATVHGIVRQSGGQIRVTSSPGQGTTFSIDLPIHRAPPAAAAAVAARPGVEEATILLVDDEAGVRGVTREILEAHGYRVIEAESGPEAARLAGGTAFDLLLSDVSMPEMSGPRLAAELLRNRPGLRVLFMSGYSVDAIDRQGALECGHGYLPKPFTVAELMDRVREVLAGRDPAPGGGAGAGAAGEGSQAPAAPALDSPERSD